METPETLHRLSDLNLSTEDIITYRRKFNTIDLNKDGKITLRELFTISRVFGYKFTVDELRVRIIFHVLLGLKSLQRGQKQSKTLWQVPQNLIFNPSFAGWHYATRITPNILHKYMHIPFCE